MYILGIDLGTTGCKASLFNENGRLVTQSYREYDGTDYTGTIDPGEVWNKVREIIIECNSSSPEIAAICITSFGETVVLMDRDDRVLCPSYLYSSGGTENEWQELNAAVGADTFYNVTGLVSHPMYTLNRILWFKKHNPAVYEQLHVCLFFSAYIARKLGADYFAEDSQAARSMVYSLSEKTWSRDILAAAGISADIFPPVLPAGTDAGCVSDDICRELNFNGVPRIIVGGHDQPCVALGMGCVHGGEAVYGLGTVECLSVVMDDFHQSPQMQKDHLICSPHVVPGKYVTYGVIYSGGNVVKTLRDTLWADETASADRQNIYVEMYDRLSSLEHQLLCVPHLFGAGTPTMLSHEGAGMIGYNTKTTPKEILKASLEGLAFDMRENIENMKENGIAIDRIYVAGGGAKSNEALMIRSDILGLPLYVPEDIQAGARGVFLIAAHALGWIEDFYELPPFCPMNEISPSSEKKAYYDAKFALYCELENLMHKWTQFTAENCGGISE